MVHFLNDINYCEYLHIFEGSLTAIQMQGAEDELVHAVAFVRPVSVAFQVVNDFRLYKSGVYTSDTCGSTPMVSSLIFRMSYIQMSVRCLVVPYPFQVKYMLFVTSFELRSSS